MTTEFCTACRRCAFTSAVSWRGILLRRPGIVRVTDHVTIGSGRSSKDQLTVICRQLRNRFQRAVIVETNCDEKRAVVTDQVIWIAAVLRFRLWWREKVRRSRNNPKLSA